MADRPSDFRVLSIEDEAETVADWVGVLEDARVSVERVAELESARQVVRQKKFDLLLVDARLPDPEAAHGTERAPGFSTRGGIDFVKALKGKCYGPLNVDSKFAIVTAFYYQLDQHELEGLCGFLGVFSKVSQRLEDLETPLGFPLLAEEVERSKELLSDDLAIVNGLPDEKGKLYLDVPSWGEGLVSVEYSRFPIEIRQELEFGDRPIYIWVTVNTAALNENDVQPRNFRMYHSDVEGEMLFDHPKNKGGRK